jgi:DNA-binding transcriptional LysR family regulator
MQSIEWTDYQAFLAIARTGQIARAANLIKVDPTTIGRRLRRLEARLGLTLFEQSRDGQLLTEAGEAILIEVEAMDLSASRIRETSVSGSVAVGTIRVSCSEGLGSAFIAPRLGSFFEQYPSIKLDLVASNGFLSPSKREADLAIVLSRPSTGAVIASKMSDYALRLYAACDYFADREPPKEPDDLIGQHRMVGYIPDLLYAPELDYLAEISPKLEANLRSSSINAQYRLIASGLAIGVLPCFIGDADPRLVPLFPERRIMRSFWIVTHKDTHKLSRIQAFKAWLVEEVRSAGASLFLPD